MKSFFNYINEANRGLTQQKNKWDTLTTSEVKKNRDVQQDIYDIINAAYGPIGGHPDFPRVDAVPADNNNTDVVDTDEPDDVDAVVLSLEADKNRDNPKSPILRIGGGVEDDDDDDDS